VSSAVVSLPFYLRRRAFSLSYASWFPPTGIATHVPPRLAQQSGTPPLRTQSFFFFCRQKVAFLFNLPATDRLTRSNPSTPAQPFPLLRVGVGALPPCQGTRKRFEEENFLFWWVSCVGVGERWGVSLHPLLFPFLGFVFFFLFWRRGSGGRKSGKSPRAGFFSFGRVFFD